MIFCWWSPTIAERKRELARGRYELPGQNHGTGPRGAEVAVCQPKMGFCLPSAEKGTIFSYIGNGVLPLTAASKEGRELMTPIDDQKVGVCLDPAFSYISKPFLLDFPGHILRSPFGRSRHFFPVCLGLGHFGPAKP